MILFLRRAFKFGETLPEGRVKLFVYYNMIFLIKSEIWGCSGVALLSCLSGTLREQK